MSGVWIERDGIKGIWSKASAIGSASCCRLAMENGSVTLSEVGRRFNRDVTTMSSAVRRLIGRARDLKVLRDRMGELKSEVV